MYTITAILWSYANGQLSSSEQTLFSINTQDTRPVAAANGSFEISEGGSIQFTLAYTHPLYDSLVPLETYVRVTDDTQEIFYGRILTKSDPTFSGQITYAAEGALSFLHDGEVPPEARDSKGQLVTRTLTAEEFFRWCINQHNATVSDPRRQFTVGQITIDKKSETRQYQVSSYTDTRNAIDQYLRGVYGGYLRARSDGNGGQYIDWLKQYDRLDPQDIEIGTNVMELTNTTSADGVYTVLRPVGQNGLLLDSPEIDLFPPAKMALIGRIVKTVSFNEADTKEKLQKLATDYAGRMESVILGETSIRLIDMHYLDGTIPKIRIGDRFDHIHGNIGTEFTVAHMDVDFLHAENDTFSFKNRKDLEGDLNGGLSGGTISKATSRGAKSAGFGLRYYHESADHALLQANEIEIIAEDLRIAGDNIRVVSDNYERATRTIEVESGIDWSQDWPDWKPNTDYAVNDPVSVLENRARVGYTCLEAHRSGEEWNEEERAYWQKRESTKDSIMTIYGTEVIQNSSQIASVAGNFQVLTDYYNDWPSWKPNTYYAVGAKVKVSVNGKFFGYVCQTPHTSESGWTNSERTNWIEQTGRKSVRLLDGAAFTIDDLNGDMMTVGERIDYLGGGLTNLSEAVDEQGLIITGMIGSALWTQRDQITGVSGQFAVITDPSTGVKTLKIISGGGMKIERNNVEYGLYDEGNMTGGLIVDKINTATWGAWVPNAQYPVGAKVNHNGSGYVCKIAHTSGDTFNSSKWDLYHSVNTKIIGDNIDIEASQVRIGSASNVQTWINEKGQTIDTMSGSALWTQREQITGVSGQFEVVTDPSTGVKTLKVVSGGGLKIRRNNAEYGLYDEGNLTGGIMVSKLNDNSVVTKIRGDRVDIEASQVRVGSTSNVQTWMSETGQDIEDLEGLVADRATISQLNTQKARIDTLEADAITTSNLSANIANITTALSAWNARFYTANAVDFVIRGADSQGHETGTSVKTFIKEVQVVPTQQANEYVLQYKTYNDNTWQDAGTFSKAASITNLAGSWSGSTLTIATNPSTGKTYTVGFSSSGNTTNLALRLNGNATKSTGSSASIDVPINVATVGSGSPPTYTTRYSETIPVSVAGLLENKGTITSNGTYAPGNSYIGISSIKVEVPDVTLNNPVWTNETPYTDGSSNTATVSTNGRPTQLSKTVPVTLSQGSWSNGVKNVDITTTNGVIVARTSVTAPDVSFSTGSWSSGSLTVTAKHGTKQLGSTTVSVPAVTATSWVNTTGRTWRADVTIGGVTRSSSTKDFGGYYSDGQNAVTLNNPVWTNETPYTDGSSNTATVSTNGRPTQLSKTVPVTLSQGSWSNGVKNVDITTTNGVIVARTSVTAPDVSFSTGSWSSGSLTVTAKHGTKQLGSTTVSVPAVTATSWVNTTGRTWRADVTIGGVTRSSSTKDFGGYYTDGQNAVTITKGSWSSGQIQFTKSAGTASTKGVKVGLSGSWSNGVYSYAINDYYDSTQGVSTGYSGTINAPNVTVSAGSWSSGSVTVTATHGTKQLGSTTVSVPAVTATSWVNTTGRTWRADVTIGGVTRSSSTKNFDSYYTTGYSDAIAGVYVVYDQNRRCVPVDANGQWTGNMGVDVGSMLDAERAAGVSSVSITNVYFADDGQSGNNYVYDQDTQKWWVTTSLSARASNGATRTSGNGYCVQAFAEYIWVNAVENGWNGYYNDSNFSFDESTGIVYRPRQYNVGGSEAWFDVHAYGYSKGGEASYTRYTFSKSLTQSSDGYHYTFAIGTGWQTPFGTGTGTYYLYKRN